MMMIWLAVACGDKDDVTTDTGTAGSDIQAIADASCGPSSHTGGAASGDLSLDDFHGSTVGVASSDVADMNLVEPGDLDNSYLWHKIEGTHLDVGGDGSAMPLGPALSDDDHSAIQAWIEDGAPEL